MKSQLLKFSVFSSLVVAAALTGAVDARAALRVEIDASDHRLTFYDGDRVMQVFKVRLGSGGIGKCKNGDKRTPLGEYTLSPARKSSDFRWFLPVNYPNKPDRAAGCTGGDIGVHGTGNLLRRKLAQQAGIDWTLGCIALTNKDIDQIRSLVKTSIQLTIKR